MSTSSAQLAGDGRRGLLGSVARGYVRLEGSERGFVWLSKLLPASVFGLITMFKALGLAAGLQALSGSPMSSERWLATGYHASTTVFFGLITVLFLARRRPIRKVGSALHGLIALLGSYIVLPIALSAPIHTTPTVLIAANLLTILGTIGAVCALTYLGRCFGIFPEARGLVTGGPYRLVRHPMYLFEFVAFLGVLLPTATLLNVLVYALFAALQWRRMVLEEQTLSATFPRDYPPYRARTPRLIPGLY